MLGLNKHGGPSGTRTLQYLVGGALLAAAFMSAAPASANGLDLGTAADYALVDLGSGTTLGWNSGPVNGDVLFGNNVSVNTSGGNNGGLGAGYTLYYDSSTNCNPSPCGSGLQNPPPEQGPLPATHWLRPTRSAATRPV